ncbi:type I restriction-modification system, specificity subunit S [Acinetobacter baumannii]|nr:type I restriction-modification system, specificity subunit S [Acinetobacter baumannii]
MNKILTLADCVLSANTGLDAIKRAPIVTVNTGIRCIRIQDISQSKVFQDWGFTEVTSNNFEKFQLKSNDILIARTGGSIGVNTFISNDLQAVYNNGLIRIRVDTEKFYPKFIYFILQSDKYREHINSIAFGTAAQPNMKIKDFLSFEFMEILLDKQKQIAKILSDLDEKIHFNNQINHTLESIAQAIFKSWFIDFEPVRAKIAAKQEGKDPELAAMCAMSGKSEEELQHMSKDDFAELQATAALFPDELMESELGEVPKGWEVSTVGDQIQTAGGATPSTKNVEFWDNGTHHWTTPKDLSNLTDKVLLNTERKITDAGLKKISSGLLPKDTVLMSSRAPVGYLALAKIKVAINQGYIAILPNKKYSAEYLIQWCEANMAEIKGRASGTTFQEISKKNFREINFICPDEKIVASYTKTVRTLYDEITSKAKENQSLINLRDTLLLKLMSGEISLNKNMGSIDDKEN